MAREPIDLVRSLYDTHGVVAGRIERLDAGVHTDNYVITPVDAAAVFVKVYPRGTDLAEQRQAISVSEYVRVAGAAVPSVYPSRGNDTIVINSGLLYSVWQYIDAPSGEHSGLDPDQLRDLGRVLAHVHQVLATYPPSGPVVMTTVGLPDLGNTVDSIERLLSSSAGDIRPDRRWLRELLGQRKDLLPRMAMMMDSSVQYQAQLIHGDNEDLAGYARARHQALFAVWEQLEFVEDLLRGRIAG